MAHAEQLAVLRRAALDDARLPRPVVSGGRLAATVAVFVLGYGAAQAASAVFTTAGGVSVWFPPAALLFVFLYLAPPALAVPIAVVTRVVWAVVSPDSSASVWLVILSALIVVSAYAVAAQTLRRRTPDVRGIRAIPWDVARFLVLAAVAGPLAAAVGTRLVAVPAGRLDLADVPASVAAFWVGDAVAIVTLVPLFWMSWRIVRTPPSTVASAELAVGAALTVGAGWVVTGAEIGGTTPLYVALVPVLALAVRHEILGATVGNAAAGLGITSALALRDDATLGVFGGHVFLIVLAVVGLTVGAAEAVRRVAVGRLAASEERFRRMIQAVEDYAIYLLDPDGRVVTWNDGAERLKGYTADQILGRHFEVLHTPEDRAAGLAARLLAEARREGHARGEGWRLRRDGSRFWAQVTLTRIDDDAGELRGFTKVTRDLTAQRQAERELEERTRQLERSNAELDRFASVASHDLQEPLRMVASYTELLGRRYGDRLDAEAQELIGYAVEGARRMRDLINDLLEYSRLHTRAERHVPVDLAEIVRTATRDLRLSLEETGATVEVGPLPTVQGDSTQLRQLFQNLLGNAVKYRGDEPPRIRVAATEAPEAPERLVMVSVHDNGIGVPATQRDVVFQPFRRLHARSRYPGTGIGLAICRRIVERHGGRIWVEPDESMGSVFRFTLSKRPPAPEEAQHER